jgi:choline/glycine/proline betaine transport protein
VEVFAQTGSEGYDLMGLSHQQIIDDVLDRYEAHLGFLTYSTQHDYASVLTPPVPPATGSTPVVAPAAESATDSPKDIADAAAKE